MHSNIVTTAEEGIADIPKPALCKATGLGEDTLQRAIAGAVPATLSALADLASTTRGAKQLHAALTAHRESPSMDRRVAELTAQATAAANDNVVVLRDLIGFRAVQAITHGVSEFAGSTPDQTTRFLGIISPWVLEALRCHQTERELDSAELGHHLALQRGAIATAMPTALQLHGGPARENRADSPAQRPLLRWAAITGVLVVLAGVSYNLLANQLLTDSVRPGTPTQPVSGSTTIDLGEFEPSRAVTNIAHRTRRVLRAIKAPAQARSAVPKLRALHIELRNITYVSQGLLAADQARIAVHAAEMLPPVLGAVEEVSRQPDVGEILGPMTRAILAELEGLTRLIR